MRRIRLYSSYSTDKECSTVGGTQQLQPQNNLTAILQQPCLPALIFQLIRVAQIFLNQFPFFLKFSDYRVTWLLRVTTLNPLGRIPPTTPNHPEAGQSPGKSDVKLIYGTCYRLD